MTMALPIAFAACTSDEFESFNNQGEALKNRKDLGQVALTVGGDAQTRWTGSMGAEVGDRIGAVLIDNKIADGSKDPMDDYKVSGTEIFTNYMYQNDGTAWRTNANLVEGNYYFYAPYVEYQGRGLLKFATPLVQTIDVDAEGNIEPNSGIANYAEAAESPMVIGYKFLASTDDNTDVTISMKHLFAYPEFKFTNNSGEAVTLSRVLIENTGTGFVATGGLKNTAVAKQLFITGEQKKQDIENARDAYEAWDKTTQPAPEFASWGDWQKVFAYDKGGKTMPEGLDELTTASLLDAPTYTELIRVDFSDNVTVADGETISFRVVMPAATFNTKDLALYFVVPDGRAYKVGMWENTTRTQVTTMLQDRYTAQDYSRDGDLGTGGKQFESEIDEDATLENAPSVVTDTESLIDLLRYERANEEAINITLAGSDIEFNQDVMDAIANMKSQSIVFSGLINVVGSKDATKPLDIDENIAFDEVIVKEGYAAFNHSNLRFGKVDIEKGATLNVAVVSGEVKENNKVVYTQGTITNNGTLVVADEVETVVNNGNIEIAKGGNIESLTCPEKKNEDRVLTVAKDAAWDYRSGAKYKVVNYGTMTIPANATIDGDVENNNAIVIAGTVTNNKVLTNNADATIEAAATATNALIKNAGELTNYGTIDCDIENQEPTKAEDIEKEVKCTVSAETGSIFLGKVSGKAGALHKELSVLSIKENANLRTVENSNLTVEYVVNELTEDTKLPQLINGNAYVNELTVNSVNLGDDLDMSTLNGASSIEALNVKGSVNIGRDQTLTLPAATTEVNIENSLSMNYGTLTWATTDVEEKAVINIASTATLTIVGATIDGDDTYGFEFVSEVDEDDATIFGRVNNIDGTIKDCKNMDLTGWWSGYGPNEIPANYDITKGGLYTIGENANWVGFASTAADATVKVIAGEGNAITIASGNESNLKALKEFIVGAGVTVTLGTTGSEWTPFNINADDCNIEGENGAVVIVVTASETVKCVSNGTGWICNAI